VSEETPGEPGAADTEPGPASGTPAAEGEASKSSGAKTVSLQVPKWAALVVAALLLLGVGFAIGWVAAPGGGDHGGAFPAGRRLPAGPDGRALPRLPVPVPGSLNGVFLGVATRDATGSPSGAQVVNVVSGSAADQAGLKAGDVVTAVDGSSIANAAQLAQQIRGHQPGDQVTITYTRGGSSTQAQVKLGSRSPQRVPSA
jgi:putative serine protease PepD